MTPLVILAASLTRSLIAPAVDVEESVDDGFAKSVKGFELAALGGLAASIAAQLASRYATMRCCSGSGGTG